MTSLKWDGLIVNACQYLKYQWKMIKFTFNLLVISSQHSLMAWTSSLTLSSSCEKWLIYSYRSIISNQPTFREMLMTYKLSLKDVWYLVYNTSSWKALCYLFYFFEYLCKFLINCQAASLNVPTKISPGSQTVLSKEYWKCLQSFQHFLKVA